MNSRVTAGASAERSGESDMVSAQDIEAVAYINGKRWVLPPGRGETTLLAFLRDIGLTGTKLGCGEVRGPLLHGRLLLLLVCCLPRLSIAPITDVTSIVEVTNWSKHSLTAGWLRGLHGHAVPLGGWPGGAPLRQCMPVSSVRCGGDACSDCGRHWEHTRGAAPGAGAAGQGPRLPVRLLHPWLCDVHVQLAALQQPGAQRGAD
ncbi:uncharacterized protein HaLaN_26245 [Haematococcus lacustris]|uniref:Uncharacterized protein n=1 Tax=Haematococcus lacustris TaxID=44745 RepID=A0A6A0A5T8_HAELA|nr:uncharacterized protein HaLaN_26245 [Haematococcus lacustris]